MNIRSLDRYHGAWWDWTPLNECFEGKIRVMDVDGIVERRGKFLLLEGKRLDEGEQPPPLPAGQQYTHDALCATGLFTVVVFWGTPPRGPIRFVRVQTKRGAGRVVPASMDDLKALVRRWYRWADGAHAPRPSRLAP